MYAVQDYMQTVLDTADSIVDGVDGVNGLLDEVQTVLDVDVNITDISTGINVSLLRHPPTHRECPTHWTPHFLHVLPRSDTAGSMSLTFHMPHRGNINVL